jgi:hypothetical protein
LGFGKSGDPSEGFIKPSGNASKEYQYNNNGALNYDFNRGISNIQYNVLNLPNLITFSEGHSAQYSYDALGMKRKVAHTTESKTKRATRSHPVARSVSLGYDAQFVVSHSGEPIGALMLYSGPDAGAMLYITVGIGAGVSLSQPEAGGYLIGIGKSIGIGASPWILTGYFHGTVLTRNGIKITKNKVKKYFEKLDRFSKLNKFEKKSVFIIGSCAIIAFVIVFFFIVTLLFHVEDTIKEKYTKVTVQDEINGIVTGKGYKKYTCIEIDNNLFIRLNVQPMRIISSWEVVSMSDIVQKGDSLIKKKNSDTILVVRDTEKYIFTLYDW